MWELGELIVLTLRPRPDLSKMYLGDVYWDVFVLRDRHYPENEGTEDWMSLETGTGSEWERLS